MTDLVQDSWDKLGHKMEVFGRRVLVRTDPLSRTTDGGIWLPPTQDDFYDGMAHQKVLTGTVIQVGTRCQVKVGDKVTFARLYFSRYEKLDDGTFVGWVDDLYIMGVVEEN